MIANRSMIAQHSANASSDLADVRRRAVALRTAVVLRDCSRSAGASNSAQRACRVLMRQAAKTWRDGTRPGQWE